MVPLSYYNSSNQPQIEFIANHSNEISVSFNDNLPKFNVENTGFYIINYDSEDWKILSKALYENASLLTPSDRANLIADSFYLSKADLLNYTISFNLTLYLSKEKHFVPWSIADQVLGFVKNILTTEYKDDFRSYIKFLTKQQFERLKWDDIGDDNKKLLRQIIIELACFNDNKECLKEASEQFDKWKNGQKFKSNLKQVVLKYGIRQNKDTHENWDFVLKKYNESNSNNEKLAYLNALANTKNQTLIKRLVLNLFFLNNCLIFV